MADLSLTITDAGRAALVNAQQNGSAAVTIASIGVSATAVVPGPADTGLPGEVKRLTAISGLVLNGATIHVTALDESSDQYTVRSIGVYLAGGTLFALYGQAATLAEKSANALLSMSFDVGFVDIDTANITFAGASFVNPPATTERLGVVEMATDEEAAAGTDTQRAVNPKGVMAAVSGWLDSRFGEGAPSPFFKGLMIAASAAAFRLSIGLKSAALKDEGPGNGLDADKLDGQEGSYYANVPARLGYVPWGPNNDGAGSGLDADTLDGDDGGRFFRYRIGTVNGGNEVAASGMGSYVVNQPGYTGHLLNFGGVAGSTPRVQLYFSFVNSTFLFRTFEGSESSPNSWQTLWHAGNDGGNSGLDADLLWGMRPNTNSAPNSIAQRDVNGDINFRYTYSLYNYQSSPNNENPGVSQVIVTNGDNYLRKCGVDNFAAQLGMMRLSYRVPGCIIFVDGMKLQWGSVSVAPNSYATVSFPAAHGTSCGVSGSGVYQDYGADENTGIVSYDLNSFSVYNAYNNYVTFFWQSVGY